MGKEAGIVHSSLWAYLSRPNDKSRDFAADTYMHTTKHLLFMPFFIALYICVYLAVFSSCLSTSCSEWLARRPWQQLRICASVESGYGVRQWEDFGPAILSDSPTTPDWCEDKKQKSRTMYAILCPWVERWNKNEHFPCILGQYPANGSISNHSQPGGRPIKIIFASPAGYRPSSLPLFIAYKRVLHTYWLL